MPQLNRRSFFQASMAGAVLAASATSASAQAMEGGERPGRAPMGNLPAPADRAGSAIDVKGGRIFFQQFGQGSPMLLVHGYPLSGALFLRAADILSRDHRLILPDLRGYGKSTASGVTNSVDVYAEDMLTLMDSLKIQKAVIGGMSMGGPTVLSMYRKAPERFDGLVLIDTTAAEAKPPEKGLWEGTAKVVESKGIDATIPGLIDKMLTGQTRMDDKAQEQYLTAIIKQCSTNGGISGAKALADRPDAMGMLSGISVPTLVLVGLDDPIYPFEVAEMMHQAIPRSSLHVVPAAAHAAIFEQAENAGAALSGWASSMQLSAKESR